MDRRKKSRPACDFAHGPSGKSPHSRHALLRLETDIAAPKQTFRSRSSLAGHAGPAVNSFAKVRYRRHDFLRPVITSALRRHARHSLPLPLLQHPALCWNSRTAAGIEPARMGAQRQAPSGGAIYERKRAGHSRPMGGRGPPRPDTAPPLIRWSAWSRGCDASAGTFQEGWQRFGGPGAARWDRPRFLAPARPGRGRPPADQGPETGAESATKTSAPSGGRAAQAHAPSPAGPARVALKNWRISTRLVSLLALPVVAATTLGRSVSTPRWTTSSSSTR